MNDNDKQPGQDNGGGNNPWMKSLLIWVGILLGLAIIVTMFDGRTAAAQGNAISYSTFVQKIDEGTVKVGESVRPNKAMARSVVRWKRPS